jgi:antirestriction protein
MSRERPDDEAKARAELQARIEAASTRRLGNIATVIGGVQLEPDDDGSIPWTDPAEWSPPLIEHTTVQLPDEEVDELFAEPDEQMGSVEDWGWHGLVRHPDRPGGYILLEDDQGFREVREFEDSEALARQWERLTTAYEAWVNERDSYESATEEAAPGHGGLAPRVYVADLNAYNSGVLHGAWFDATLDPETLTAAATFMIRISPERGGEEWAIHDHDDFGGYRLSEYASLEEVSRIAQGLSEYGASFGAWLTVAGNTDEETCEVYNDAYRGEYDSFKDYVEELIDESEYDRILERLPEDIRQYVIIDTEAMARDWEADYEVVSAPGGGVFIFEQR